MRKLTALLFCLILLVCLPPLAAAEISYDEQDYFYEKIEDLVYDIGNRNVSVEGHDIALNYLIQEYESFGCDFEDGTLSLCEAEGTTYWGYEFTCSSVIGAREAVNSEPNIIVLCAHFDSNGPGARDNASGVAGVLLFLQRFYQMEPYENTELRFIAFTAEETGHQGSQAYVASLTEDEKERIIAVFNLDIIVVDIWQDDYCLSCDTLGGRTASGYAQGQDGVPASNSASRAFLQAIADLSAFDSEDDGVEYAVRHMGSSDHDSFHFAGIDSVSISFRGNVNTDGSWTDLIHTESDLIGDFDWDRTWQALDIVYAAVDGLARDAGYGE